MRCHLTLAMIACLAACDGPASDGFRFSSAEYDREEVMLRVVEHSDLAELRAAARVAGAHVDEGREVMAWSLISPDRSTCTMHIVDPRRGYQPEWLGHEVAHCIHGRWHP